MERESTVLRHKDLRHKEIVQPFLIDAFKEGAHRTKPKTRLPSQDQWDRQIMIGVVYNDIGSTATVEELAEKYSTFKQSIANSNKRFLRNLWNNSSPELQERYPLNEVLTARRPWSQRSREKASASQGGTSLRIKAQFESGVTDRDKISENTGIPKRIVAISASSKLKDWGINVPRKNVSHREALKQLEEETNDKKIQELLDGLPYFVIAHDLKRKREASQFSPLSPLIREAGFGVRKKHAHFFASSLRNAGVPISIKDRLVKGAKPQTLTYYILLSRHKDRAIQALKDDQSLQKFQRESG